MPSLFALMFDPRRSKAFRPAPNRLPVWPYYFLCLVSLIAAGVLIVGWWPRGFPDAEELTMVSGKISTVVIRDDISKTTAGAAMPSLTSAYFTIEGVEGTFRYPSTHPRYFDVAFRTSGSIDILVEKAALGSGQPVMIWQIEEHSPFNVTAPPTFVAFDEVYATVTENERSIVRSGYWLLPLVPAFLAMGVAVRRINRGRPPVGP